MSIRVHSWFRGRRRPVGLTLIELTVALALATILMGLVIVRFSWASPRQQAIAEARKIGNLIRTFRERAQAEEREYALRLDLCEGRYEVLAVSDRGLKALESARAIRQGVFAENVRISLTQGERELSSPAVLYFNRHGVLPETAINLTYGPDSTIALKPDPLTNEVVYEAE